ncbi:alpha/beta fold hydrolase [Pseudonocardia humida]|uniref:Alpha/beta hydrolase n=1 Tax=Pseudonocardia humida TaxID=2800819 RepID=A0ABT1AC44_9PSEU|nr:alpha/beta fold hydrolase [Pseudonocardia humida]MCO1660600.1 alpha/beta hydrolase [Pseudonocardia humida]
MTDYVLVHGSWLGGWSWEAVRPALESAGHRVLAPSLTGLADRGHLAGPDVGLGTHIEDIVRLLTWEALDEVVLVGHSYGGMVITGVAGRLPQRLAHLVYLDAFRPEPGQSAFDVLPDLPRLFGEPPAEHPWGWGPLDPALLGTTAPDEVDWLLRRATPMPTATHTEPLPPPSAPVEVPTTYVLGAALPLFAATADEAAAAGATVLRWEDAGHHLPLQFPQRTAELLLALGGRGDQGGTG